MSADAAAAPVLNEPGPAQGRGREADERADGGFGYGAP